MNQEATASAATPELVDPVVRDLVEAIGILAACRQQAATFPSTTVWAILNASQGHLERQLRDYLTGSGLKDRAWPDRRR